MELANELPLRAVVERLCRLVVKVIYGDYRGCDGEQGGGGGDPRLHSLSVFIVPLFLDLFFKALLVYIFIAFIF